MATPAPPEQPWPEIPGYQIIRLLGRGGMGVVYEAEDLRLRRRVAVKMLQPGIWGAEDDLPRLQAEAEIIARLHHPQIVQIFECGQYQGQPFLTLELVRGESLAHYLAGRPQTPREAAALVTTLARAVHYAHQQGVIHRDLKPGNILLAVVRQQGSVGSKDQPPANRAMGNGPLATAQPKITDFGLAKCLDAEAHLTQSGVAIGTPSYMAPEQAMGAKTAPAPAADIYSLGAILYEMLTGRPPFQAPTPLDTVLMVRYEEPVPPRQLQPKLPRDLETICLHCLQKEPQRRYASAAELADDLDCFLQGQPIRARPVGALGKVFRWCRREPRTALLLGLLLTVLGISLAVISHLYWQSEQLRSLAEQRQRDSERHFRQARAAVQECFQEATQNPLLRQPGMQPARENLLRSALKYYREFLAESGADPDLRDELARAHGSIGLITMETGSRRAALNDFVAARELWQRLSQEQPQRLEYRLYLAQTWFHIGRVEVDQGHSEAATAAYAEAQALLEPLTNTAEQGVTARQALALVCRNRGNLAQAQGQPAQAQRHYQRAVAYLEELLVQEPNRLSLQLHLATTLLSKGNNWGRQRRPHEARQAFHQAKELLEKLAASAPQHEEVSRLLAKAYGSLALLTEEESTALDYQRRSVALLEELVQTNPAVVEYRHDLAKTCMNLGHRQQAEQQYTAALKSYQRAEEMLRSLLQTTPNSVPLLEDLASVCHNLGLVHRVLGQQALQAAKTQGQWWWQQALQLGPRRDPLTDLRRLANWVRGATILWRAIKGKEHLHAGHQAYYEAIVTWRTLTQTQPALWRYWSGLANACNNLANLQRTDRRWTRSEETYQEALQLYAHLRRHQPFVAEYAAQQSRTERNLGLFLLEQQRIPDGLAWLRRSVRTQRLAVTLAPTEETHWKQLRHHLATLSIKLREAQQVAEAAILLEERRVLAQGQPRELVVLAREMVQCFVLAQQLPSWDHRQVERCATTAVEILREAKEAGYTGLHLLRTSEEFAPLQSCPDFQALFD
jgi:serine/threonine protein kinase